MDAWLFPFIVRRHAIRQALALNRPSCQTASAVYDGAQCC